MQGILDSFFWDAFYRSGNDWGQPNAGVLTILGELQKTFDTPSICVLDLACGNGRYAVPR